MNIDTDHITLTVQGKYWRVDQDGLPTPDRSWTGSTAATLLRLLQDRGGHVPVRELVLDSSQLAFQQETNRDALMQLVGAGFIRVFDPQTADLAE